MPPSALPKAPAAVIPLSRAKDARARMAPIITPPPATVPALPPPSAVPVPVPGHAPAALPAPAAKPARSRAHAAPAAPRASVAPQPLTLMILGANGARTRHIRVSAALVVTSALIVACSVAGAVAVGWSIGAFTAGFGL
jgi:hypothetical protein